MARQPHLANPAHPPPKRLAHVGPAFQPAGDGDFPVPGFPTGRAIPVNPPAGKPALRSAPLWRPTRRSVPLLGKTTPLTP